jgi:hypothetical protein
MTHEEVALTGSNNESCLGLCVCVLGECGMCARACVRVGVEIMFKSTKENGLKYKCNLSVP